MLTLQDVANQLPEGAEGAFTETADDVTISLKTLLKKASVQLSDAFLADFIHDFLLMANQAQISYNQANPSAQINSFNNPLFGAATRSPNGSYAVNTTFTVITRSPVDFGSTTTNP